MFSQEGTLHWSCKTWRLVKSAQLCSNMRLMNRTDSPSALLVIIGPQVWRHGWGDEHGRCLDSKPWFCNSKNQLARRLSERPITKPGQSTDRSTFNLMHQAEQQGKVGLSCTGAMTTDLNVLWQHLGMRNKIEHWDWPAKIQSLWTIPKLSFRPKLWRLCNLRAMWKHVETLAENRSIRIGQEDGWRVHKLKSAWELNENVVSSKLLYALVNHATNHLYTLLTFHRSVWRVVIPIIILQDLMERWNSAISECCDLFMRKHGKQEKSRNKEGRHFSLSLGLCLVSTASLVGADKSYNLIQPYPKSSFWCDRIAFTYLCLICHDWDVFLQFSTYHLHIVHIHYGF